MSERVCCRCKIKKDYSCFHKDVGGKDGIYSICKECRKPLLKAWQPSYRKRHAEVSREYRKRHPDRSRENTRKWRELNPDKKMAHLAIQEAIEKKILFREPCLICNSKIVEGHHWKGYSKENHLAVVWLCHQHHKDAHAGIINVHEKLVGLHDCKQDGEHGCEVCAEWWGQERTKWVDYPRPEEVHSMIQPQED